MGAELVAEDFIVLAGVLMLAGLATLAVVVALFVRWRS